MTRPTARSDARININPAKASPLVKARLETGSIDSGTTRRLIRLPTGVSIEYGAYMVETGGCKVCHHDDLRGGLHPLSLPGEPPPSDLTASGRLASWSEADFLRSLRTGRTPDGRRLENQWMPWKSIGRMSDLELNAIWKYLESLQELPQG